MMYPHVNMNTVPVMQNYPVTGQPINTTRSGVTYDAIRNALANYITQFANTDAITRYLTQECLGPNQNWMSGKMDKLVNMVAITLDYDWSAGKGNVNDLLTSALQEVFWCAWANVSLEPHTSQLARDPSVARNQQLLQQWQAVRNQRLQQFQQAGLLQNNAVQNQPMMNYPQYAPQVGPGQMVQQAYYSNPGYNGYNNYNRQPMQYNHVPQGMQASQVSNMYAVNNQGYNQTQNYQPTQAVKQDAYNDLSDLEDEINRRQNEAFFKQSNVTKSNYQVESMTTTSSQPAYNTGRAYETTASSYQHMTDITNINQVPERKSVLPSQPKEIMEADGKMNMDFVKQWDGQPVKVIDTSDEKQMTELFEKAVVKEARMLNLLEDEVRVLERAEVISLSRYGKVKFEKPYCALIAANPHFNALHCVLTDKNEIRQILTRLGEPMRLSSHLDILKPIRETKEYNKSINPHCCYHTTTLGGVVFDRFKASKVVLTEALEAVNNNKELDEDERKKAIDEAFDKYNEAVVEDIRKDHAGITKFLEENRKEGQTEDDAMMDFLLTEEQQQAAIEVRQELIPTLTAKESLVAKDVYDTTSTSHADKLAALEPITTDVSDLRKFELNNIVSVFNTPKEKEDSLNALSFFVLEENGARKPNVNSTVLAKQLARARDIIPVELFTRINNLATEIVNITSKHVLRLDNDVYIDSFADDYQEFLKYVIEHDTKDTNLGLTYLDIALCNNLCVLENESSLSISDDKNDYVALRAITETKHIEEIAIPELSTTLGLTEDINVITSDNTDGVYQLAQTLYVNYVNSYSNLGATQEALSSVFIRTADNHRYRILPTIMFGSLYDDIPEEEITEQSAGSKVIPKGYVLQRLPLLF